MEENVVKMWQWNWASNDVDTGGIKAEFKDTVENEDKEFETLKMGYPTEVNETNEETARGTDKQTLMRKMIFQIWIQ